MHKALTLHDRCILVVMNAQGPNPGHQRQLKRHLSLPTLHVGHRSLLLAWVPPDHANASMGPTCPA